MKFSMSATKKKEGMEWKAIFYTFINKGDKNINSQIPFVVKKNHISVRHR